MRLLGGLAGGDLERVSRHVECSRRHARVADGLFARSGLFYVLPDTSLKPLDELLRARVIRFLAEKGLVPPERANMLRGWVHSGEIQTLLPRLFFSCLMWRACS